MATFLFSLTPSASDTKTFMIFDALHTRFPMHQFRPVQPNAPELEDTIVPVAECNDPGEDPGIVDFEMLEDVVTIFQDLVLKARGWKPS